MTFREVSVVQIREALRRWMKGQGHRSIAKDVGIDRKTARRYVTAAIELDVDRSGGEDQLTDELTASWSSKCAHTGPTGTASRGAGCWQRRHRSTSGSRKTSQS
jgi:hypothetical protein